MEYLNSELCTMANFATLKGINTNTVIRNDLEKIQVRNGMVSEWKERSQWISMAYMEWSCKTVLQQKSHTCRAANTRAFEAKTLKRMLSKVRQEIAASRSEKHTPLLWQFLQKWRPKLMNLKNNRRKILQMKPILQFMFLAAQWGPERKYSCLQTAMKNFKRKFCYSLFPFSQI